MSQDTEQEDDFGTPEERQRILSILKEWVGSYSDHNMLVYFTSIDINLTLDELMSHIEEETAIGVVILDILVLNAQELKERTRSEITKFLGGQFPLAKFKEWEKDEE